MHFFNFSFINLGCTKNLVDTQHLLGKIFSLGENNKNYKINYFSDPYDENAEFVFLNSCGFISSGRYEMMDTIERLKKAGKTVYLLGCGLQYYKVTSHREEGNDTTILTKLSSYNSKGQLYFLSRNDFEKLSISKLIKGYNSTNFEGFNYSNSPRAYTNLEYKFEYLKIAEGCDNNCTFCIIPKLRGKQKSLPIEKILDEAKNMIAAGIEEIILIAQDSTRYGTDLYGKTALFDLLKKLDKLPGDFTYRLLYLYPDILTLNHLEQLKKLKKRIPYFDIPLQHISSSVLKNMGRFYDKEAILNFLDYIHKNFPTRFIRTNIIVGFPGETDKDFQDLKKFIQKSDFDNIALFEYHDEPFASSSNLPNKVDEKIIRKRFLELDDIVDKNLTEKEEKRKDTDQTGYIVDIKETKTNRWIYKMTVRPILSAPDIDPYDIIDGDQIESSYNETGMIAIGTKIDYVIK